MDPSSRLPDQYFSALEVRMNKLKCIALVPNLIAGCIAGNSAGPTDQLAMRLYCSEIMRKHRFPEVPGGQ